MTPRQTAWAVVVAVGAALCIGCGGTAPETTGDGAAGSAARTAWDEPDLTGVWQGQALGAQPGKDTFNLAALEGRYTPEARARMQKMSAKDDPLLRCGPPPFPHAAKLGHRLQIVQSPGFAFVFTEAYPVARIIPTTGRPHTSSEYLFPSHMGDSTAQWEGDTLVVDVTAFNGEGWLAGPLDKPTSASPGVWLTSPAMHTVERWRRVDADTLEYRARVDDPDLLTMPWETPAVMLKRQPVDAVSEPFRPQWLGQTEHGFASVVLLHGIDGQRGLNALRAIAQRTPGTVWVDKLEITSLLLGAYRRKISAVVGLGYLLVLATLIVRYGRAAWRVIAPTLVASLATCALFGWVGLTFNLFTVLALLLVLGIGIDYGIYLQEEQEDSTGAWLAVSLSAASTLLSFGLLAFSRTPALQIFGLTMVCGVGLAWLLAPSFNST